MGCAGSSRLIDRKSTRLNSSHRCISYAVFCLKKKRDYIPRPEWYFAGIFPFVNLFAGRGEVLGALVIPGAAMVAMSLLPWLDFFFSSTRGPRGATLFPFPTLFG